MDRIANAKALGGRALGLTAARSTVILSSGPTGPIYGGASAVAATVLTATIRAGTIRAGSLLAMSLLVDFALPKNAGRVIGVTIGGQQVLTSFPTSAVGSINVMQHMYVAPDLQSVFVQTSWADNVLSPAASAGSPFSTLTGNVAQITVDLTVDQTLVVQLTPTNNDVAELKGFTLESLADGVLPSSYAASTATIAWGDSLTNGSGSIGQTAFSLAGTSTNASATVTMVSTTGAAVGQIVTGPGVAANTTVTAVSTNTSITLSQAAGAAAAAGTFELRSGPWPSQLMFASAGRPVVNAGIGGQTSTQILARILADKIRSKYWTNVFWMGRNDNFTTQAGQDGIIANVAAAVANLSASAKYVVCSLTTAQGEITGTGANNSVLAVNTRLAAAYPNNYVNLFATVCTNNGSPPANWLADGTAGQVHLNDLGYLQVMNAIKTKLTALGA